MKIIVDNREHTLIKLLQALSKDYFFDSIIEVKQLVLGDVIIQNDKGTNLLIIERKNLADLAGSIRDGRYSEQSFRLNENPIHNHNIMYLIEGSISSYTSKFSKIKPDTLYTTMFSLNYFKGFSVFRTFDVSETAEYILRITDKLHREGAKNGYYTPDYVETKQNYSSVVAQNVKKHNITPENISTIILSQIPGVSNKTAETIMSQHDSLYGLMEMLKKDNKCLDETTYKTTKDKERKISKTAIKNIIQYLML